MKEVVCLSEHEYILAIQKCYMCEFDLARKILESAKKNSRLFEIDTKIKQEVKQEK